jgi:hypothetical protein
MATERERQTSNKAGVKSLGKKLDNSRHGFNQQPASGKIAGAFAHEERVRGTHESSSGTTHRAKVASLGRMKKRT